MGEEVNELEQQKYYALTAKKTSESLALFYCCVKYDVPFARDCVPRDGSSEPWLAYIDNLRLKKRDVGKDGKALGFLDGLTDITKIFGEGLKDGEFTKAVYAEKSMQTSKAGTVRQRKDWGVGNDAHPYTNEDYDEFDRIYTVLVSDFGGEDSLSAKQQLILRNVARWMKQMNDLTAAGQFDKAKKVSGLIQENLASDNLRKKDIRPADIIRVDEITDRLEKAGLLKNGKQCSPDEMFEYFFGRKPRYPYTADAVDQMILINENRMRQNDGMPELSMLPDEMRIHDELGEFAEEPNAQEKDAYDKLGLVRMPPLKDGKK
nr:MAG TPA: hypothetical protein [Caudoviricetes sp.]